MMKLEFLILKCMRLADSMCELERSSLVGKTTIFELYEMDNGNEHTTSDRVRNERQANDDDDALPCRTFCSDISTQFHANHRP